MGLFYNYDGSYVPDHSEGTAPRFRGKIFHAMWSFYSGSLCDVLQKLILGTYIGILHNLGHIIFQVHNPLKRKTNISHPKVLSTQIYIKLINALTKCNFCTADLIDEQRPHFLYQAQLPV